MEQSRKWQGATYIFLMGLRVLELLTWLWWLMQQRLLQLSLLPLPRILLLLVYIWWLSLLNDLLRGLLLSGQQLCLSINLGSRINVLLL